MSRPDLSYLKNVMLAVMGVGAGIWCGASGMALAPLLAPLLGWLIGARGHRLGASVLVVTLAASVATLLAYGQAQSLHWEMIGCVAVASIAGSLVGSLPQLLILRTSPIVRLVFLLAIAAIGGWMIFAAGHAAIQASGHAASVGALIVAGFAAGLFAALANVGGVLIVPALLTVAHTPMLAAQGASLATLALLSAAPAASSFAQQRYPPRVAVWCAFGALMGALYGSRLAIHESSGLLASVYGVGLIVVALVNVATSRSSTSNRTAPMVDSLMKNVVPGSGRASGEQ